MLMGEHICTTTFLKRGEKYEAYSQLLLTE